MQQLKDIARNGNNWYGEAGSPPVERLSYVQREALDMIMHKVGRIVTGDPNEPDHWADIEGYARLVRERIKL